MPLTEGAHAIFARATDENGQTADSNAIHIQATAPVGLIVSQITEGGETLVSLAELTGSPPKISRILIHPSTRLEPFRPGRKFSSLYNLSACPLVVNPPIHPHPMVRLPRLKKAHLLARPSSWKTH